MTTSVSSPRSSAMTTTSGSSSARDSLSSIASSVGEATPTEAAAAAGHNHASFFSSPTFSPMSPPPTAALDELARATKPWIPLPAGFNKWTPTLEKHSKRASLLVSDVTDMSSSILGSLSSALLSSGGASSSSSPLMAVTSRAGTAAPSKRRSPEVRPSPAQRLSQVSLLDEDDDALDALLSVPIKPQASPISSKAPSPRVKSASANVVGRTPSVTKRRSKKAVDTDEEEWNW